MLLKEFVNKKLASAEKIAEAEGYPLTMENCKKYKKMRDLKIYGNSIQEAETLFDISTMTLTEGYYLKNTGEEVANTGWKITDYIEVDNYNFILENVSFSEQSICAYDENKNFITGVKYGSSWDVKVNVSISSETRIKYIRFSIYNSWITYGAIGAIRLISKIPSPEDPIEIQSVGDKTVNLFREDLVKSSVTSSGFTCDYEGDGIFHIYGSYVNTSASTFDLGLHPTGTMEIPLETTSYYTLYAKKISADADARVIPYFGSKSEEVSHKNWLSASMTTDIAVGQTTYRSLRANYYLENTISTSRFWFYLVCAAGTTLNIDIRVQVWFVKGREGDVEYEPYGKYKIPVVCRGKNLFDAHVDDDMASFYRIGFEKTFNDDNSFNLSATSLRNNYVYIGGSNSYSANQSCFIPKGQSISTFGTWDCIDDTACIGVCLYDSNKVLAKQFNGLENGDRGEWTTSKDIYYISYCIRLPNQVAGNALDINNIKIQFEVNSVATEWEEYIEPVTTNIYLDEPLRKLSNYADYIDFKNDKVVRLLHEFYIDGSQTVSKYNDNICIVQGEVSCKYIYGLGMSNYFPHAGYGVSHYVPYICMANAVGYGIQITHLNLIEGVTDAESLKEWLKTHHTRFIQLLETPIEEAINIELPQLKAKTSIIEVDTSLAPSNIIGKYIKR